MNIAVVAIAWTGVASGTVADQADRSRPESVVAMSISDRDFPLAPFAAGIEGDVTIRYVVGPDGRVSDCFVERSTGSSAYGEFACILWYQRARFRPALGRDGRPTTATRRQALAWRFGANSVAVTDELITITQQRCASAPNLTANDPRCRRARSR